MTVSASFLPFLSFSLFPLFFPPLSLLGVSECSCARDEPGRADGDTEGGQAGGAGFAEATGGRRRTDGQTETDGRTDAVDVSNSPPAGGLQGGC